MQESIRNRIQAAMIERAPNSLTLRAFESILGVGQSEIEPELKKLVTEGILIERPSNAPYKRADYLLKSYEGIPVREFVTISGVQLPRLHHGDTARPEDLNLFMEVLARRLLAIEADADRKMEEKLRRYWGEIVTLFGAFIGVFALIVAFLRTAPLDKDASFSSVILLMSAQVLPLALILAGFVWFLRRQFR